jgi:hypothetical protein
VNDSPLLDVGAAPPPVSDELRSLDPSAEAGPAAATGLPPPAAGMSKADAAALARLGLDWVLAAVTRQYPVLSYSEETRARGAELAAAVLIKYDVIAWAGRWRAEFELGLFVAGFSWESYQKIQAAKAAPPADSPPADSPPADSPPP